MNNSFAKTPKRSTLVSWIGAILVFFGAIFAVAGRYSIKKEQAFEAKGVSTQGTITGKHSEDNWDTDSQTKRRTKRTTYYLQYSFNPNQGSEIKSRGSVSTDTYNNATPGEPIEIQYIPGDLNQNRIAGQNDYTAGLIFIGIGSVIILAGLGALFYDIKNRKLFNRLINEGMLVEANVTSVAPGNLSINRVKQWRIGYSFKDIRGHEQKGMSSHLPPEQVQALRVGDKGKVKYDRDNSALNVWIGN